MQSAILLDAYTRHEAELLQFLSRQLGCASLAKDLAHDVWLKIYKLENPSLVRNPRAFLFKTAANLARDYTRVERRRSEIRDQAQGTVWPDAEQVTPEEHAIARAELRFLEREMANLPARCRRVLYLYRFEERSQAQIADNLGVGITTVYKDLKLAMSVLSEARRRFRSDP
ncbi:MAG: RNA polymerase sigma factor [Pseudomonadota bacterium]